MKPRDKKKMLQNSTDNKEENGVQEKNRKFRYIKSVFSILIVITLPLKSDFSIFNLTQRYYKEEKISINTIH